MKVVELKEALKERGLDMSGKRAELLERLLGTGQPVRSLQIGGTTLYVVRLAPVRGKYSPLRYVADRDSLLGRESRRGL